MGTISLTVSYATPEFGYNIVGGKEVLPHSAPWQVSIRLTSWGSTRHFCGGVIFNENWVLTAAHCCRRKRVSRVSVLAGAHSLSDKNEEMKQIRKVKKLHANKAFSYSTGANDICLIELSEPLEFTE